MEWISGADAEAFTGSALTEAQLVNASYDVFDFMRWQPDITIDFLDASNKFQVRQKRVLGQAIAWQAAYSTRNNPLAVMDRAKRSEQTGRHKVEWDKPLGMIAGRVASMLAGAWLCRHDGETVRRTADDASRRLAGQDNELIIPVT